ncbi:uncharacterized protein [Aristolochia californica]|uniref:uncharacterized protein n=1 Tax=Aristolochia californica TaxID=171875 RepID=UPI0035D5AE7D
MLDEYDRHNTKSLANGASPRLRAFLFPACPDDVSAPAPPSLSFVEPKPLEQRYVDAVNSVFRASTSMFNISSSDSPPMSINETGLPYCNGVHEPSEQLNRLGSNGGGMPRVRSSPTLFNLGNHQNHLHHYHPHHQRLARLAPAPVLTGTCMVPQHSSQNRYFRQNWVHQDGSGENGRIHYSGGMEWMPHHLQSPK